MLFKGPQARRSPHKADHTKGGLWLPTQGGTHKRRSVATARVMLSEGPKARRCTHKAEHTKGGLWPPHESCYLSGHRQGGAHTRRNTQKAVCGGGGGRWGGGGGGALCILSLPPPPPFVCVWL